MTLSSAALRTASVDHERSADTPARHRRCRISRSGITPPDISPWLAGNTGVAGFTTFDRPSPGPHVALIALTHGNELAGAIVLDRLLRAGLRPTRGQLTFGFLNLAAFDRFDPRQPTAVAFR